MTPLSSPVIDFHTHVFPDYLGQWLSKRALNSMTQRLDRVRQKARYWAKPFLGSIHSVQTTMRYFPEVIRKNLDEVGSLVPLLGVVVESTHQDLSQSMQEAGVDYALIIAHPPLIPNEFVLSLAKRHPQMIPVVNISKNETDPKKKLRHYVKKGARAIKIHPAADGEGFDTDRYKILLNAATDLGLPVILHTGSVHVRFLYKEPSQGRAEIFCQWYRNYPQTQFVLAHMNFHEPHIALDLCEEHPNLFVETSWQPAEIIGEAVRRIGAERVLFGTDWPLIGNNMLVGRQRMEDCVSTGMLNTKQAKLILGGNAAKLLGVRHHAVE